MELDGAHGKNERGKVDVLNLELVRKQNEGKTKKEM